ncbi:MAG: LytTR family transcriptional regulator DNA-binding domain-containing protein, partial [Clostridium sp.]|nr:LytTR family transcriptional regulator DNA-binding domain-containing protein [Clostridium sp.]
LNIQRLNHHRNLLLSRINYHRRSEFTERISHRPGIQEIAAHLPDIFVQCHRSCIVNLSHITKIDGNTIYLSNKTTQTISRRYVTNVKTKYIKYITTGGNL